MTLAPVTVVPLLVRRCNPYGAETGGPRRVMAGLHGPASARLESEDLPGLPDAVMQGEWRCQWPAVVRVRMTCRCGHQGEPMELCSWHDETVWGGEMVAGVIRRVSHVTRSPGHFEMIARRQAGACIRCLYPGRYAEDYKALFRHQQELALLRDAGQWHSVRAAYKRQAIEDLVAQFDAGQQSNGGPIHKCPMTLEAVS
jgi:hypothetical protein